MASIERRSIGNGKFEYRARWRDDEDKSRRSKWYPRKLDAERHRDTVAADLHRGAYVDMSNRTSVAEYARAWVEARPLRKRTLRQYDKLIRIHLEPTPLGRRPLVRVKPSEIQSWATSRTGILGPYTLRIQLRTLRSIFATAVLDGLIASNPVQSARRLTLPPLEHNPVVPLTVEQVQALADEMPERYRAMVVAHAGLGLRAGELLALRVQDVNFLRREVRVEHQLEEGTLRRVPPKTPKSRRTLPMPTVVAEALAAHIASHSPASDGTIFTPSPNTTKPRGPATGLGVYHAMYGTLVREAAERAGLPPTTTHDLRHHYPSVLLHAGESVHAVAEQLGHTNAALVLTTYGHLMPNQEDRTRRAIDTAWSEAARERETGS
jgi:integrase